MKTQKKKPLDLSRLAFDLKLLSEQKVEWVIGFDEVGYGCFAGPITVGATAISKVKLEESFQNELVNFPALQKIKDSKKTTEELREKLNEGLALASQHTDFILLGIGSATAEEINKFGVTHCHNLATQRALDSLLKQKADLLSSSIIIVDGNKIDACLKDKNTISVIKGDDTSFTVGCAANYAKYNRDNEMKELAKKYPSYNFDSNKGYGTPDHREAIRQVGLCPEHRIKYCQNTLK